MELLGSPEADEEVVDEPMSRDELALAREMRHQPDYVPHVSANPLHENWTDTEVLILSPLWDTNEPLSPDTLDHIIAHHPVLEVRLDRPFNRDAYECYARYCLRRYEFGNDAQWLETCRDVATAHRLERVLARLKRELL